MGGGRTDSDSCHLIVSRDFQWNLNHSFQSSEVLLTKKKTLIWLWSREKNKIK